MYSRLSVLLLGLLACQARAAHEDLLALSLEELARIPVTAASGYAQPQSEAPGSAVIINAAEWEALGAQSVYDVLRYVPDLYVIEVGKAERRIVARGLLTTSNSQVLWLLDGMPINELGENGPPLAFDKGLAGLARIEVIHGPVSVVHGSSAFSAVINLVSQDAGSPNNRMALRGGSFDSRQAQLELGGHQDDWRWRLSLEARANDGDPDRIIHSDLQSRFDALIGTHASLAPGPLPADDDIAEALVNLSWRQTSLQLWHWQNTAANRLSSSALDPENDNKSRVDHLALRQDGELADAHLRWQGEALYQRQEVFLAATALPPGTVLPIGTDGNLDFATGQPVLFPEGIVTRSNLVAERRRLALSLYGQPLPNHSLRLNLGQEWHTIDTINDQRNFGTGMIDGTQPVVYGLPLPNLAGTSLSLLPPVNRQLRFAALEDDWRLTNTLLVNLGVRYDAYSDAGHSTNPRLNIQWQASPATRLRVGYGTAFRAPSFFEQGLRNSPQLMGNPDLEPETLTNTEIGIEHELDSSLRLGLTAFHYKAKNLIEYAPSLTMPGFQAQNLDQQTGRGGTVQLNWQPHPGTRLNAYVTRWNVRDDASGQRMPFVPGYLAGVSGWWRVAPGWTVGGTIKHLADRPREVGDTRSDIADDTWADLHMHTTALAPGLTLGLTIQNVADAHLHDPTPNGPLGPTTPEDLPLTGRTVLLQASYAWETKMP